MGEKTNPDDPKAARLAAALKANMARRKAQARARAAATPRGGDRTDPPPGQDRPTD